MRARRSPRIDWILAERGSVALAPGASTPAGRRLREDDEDDESQPSSSSSSAASAMAVSPLAAAGSGGRAAPASADAAGAEPAAEVDVSVARSLPLEVFIPGTVPRTLRAMTFGTATGARDDARPMRSQREPGWMTSV